MPGRPKGRQTKTARATRPSRKIQIAVRLELLKAVEELHLDVSRYKNVILSGSVAEVNRIINELQDKWRQVYGSKSKDFAAKWVGAVSARQKEEFQKGMAQALGVDFTAVFDDKIVYDAADFMALEASHLIKKIPEEYFNQVQEAVLQNYQQLPLPEGRSLTEQIQHIYGVSKARAFIIARDQTSKINAAVTQARNEEVGIEEYIWRTAGDIRVVGTPGGLYPKGNSVHGNHFERNRQVFKWSDPPPDGHPGYAINCRCFPVPVVDVKKLKYV